MPISMGKEKVFIVKYPSCKISELMIFRKSGFSLFYRYQPKTRTDEDGREAEPFFKPKKGLSGDGPPSQCPQCKGKLNVKKTWIVH